MAPTPQEYEVARDALREDAGKWKRTADLMGKVRNEVFGLRDLAPYLGFLAEDTGADDAYLSVRQVLEDLSEEAVTEFNYGAECLITVASEYQRAEDENDSAIRKAWHL